MSVFTRSSGQVELNNQSQPNHLTVDEARKMLEHSLGNIQELRPTAPSWLLGNHSNAQTPFNKHKISKNIDSFIRSAMYPGLMGWLIGLFGSGIIKTITEVK